MPPSPSQTLNLNIRHSLEPASLVSSDVPPNLASFLPPLPSTPSSYPFTAGSPSDDSVTESETESDREFLRSTLQKKKKKLDAPKTPQKSVSNIDCDSTLKSYVCLSLQPTPVVFPRRQSVLCGRGRMCQPHRRGHRKNKKYSDIILVVY